MNKFGESVSKLRKASSKALDRARVVSGQSNDQDLRIYENLTMDDFKRISDQYGQEATIQYIKYMEARRMKNAPR